jgi:hypothetical protein
MPSLWEVRELPLLKAILDCEASCYWSDRDDLYDSLEQDDTDLELEEIMLSLYALAGAEPPYVRASAERIDAEDQPEVKGKLERFRESVQDIGREVFVGVLTSLTKQSAGLP